jgi:hypothetical protein
LREQRRRRSLAQVAQLLQVLHQLPEQISTADALALREQISRAADPIQPSLPLSPIPPKGSPS